MRWRLWVVLDLVVLVACLGAVVPSWHAGIVTDVVAATGEQPAVTTTRYSGPWLGLATLLVAVAGLAALDLVARCAGSDRQPQF